MLSFLAHLEGGVSISEEEDESQERTRSNSVAVRAGLRAKLLNLVNAEISGEYGHEGTQQSSTQVRRARHHTAASLFNLLYEYLREDKSVRAVDDEEAFAQSKAGDLIEFGGAYLGNPLEEMIQLMQSLMPYVAPDDKAHATKQTNPRSGNPQRRSLAGETTPPAKDSAQATKLLLERMSKDIAASPAHDLLVRLDDKRSAVLVASSQYFSVNTSEMLRAGDIRVVGKVTKALSADDQLSLSRRTVIGIAGEQLNDGLLADFRSVVPGIELDSLFVKPPALQVIPMAIFV